MHALGQVFHVDAPDTHRIPADKWPAAINTRLPRTIRVIHAEYTDPGFHARFSATGKTYRYCISSEPILNPFDAGLVWHRPLAWSLDALAEAAGLFLGEHDFTAFAALRGNEPRPIPEDYFRRTITRADVRREGNRLIRSPRPDDKSPFCAPPDGLTLMQVHYPDCVPKNRPEQ